MKRMSSDELNQQKNRKLSWVTNTIILFSFLCILFYGLTVFAFGQEEEASDVEGRMLEQRPSFSVSSFLDGTYTETFESSANDQVFQRDFWIAGQAWFQRNILRQQMNNGVFNIDGMLLSPDTNASEYSGLGEFLEEFQKQMENDEIPVYFASAPSKPVYATRHELFPAYVETVDLENREQLHERVNEAGIPLIDLERRLETLDGEEVYFKTDHHWRAEGAFAGYEEIMSVLSKDYPESRILAKEDMKTNEVDGPFYGSSAREISIAYVEEADTFTYLEPIEGFSTTVCRDFDDCGHEVLDRDVLKNTTDFTNYYNIFLGDNYAQLKIEQKNPINDLHVLVLKDSYANPLLGYLGESFGKVSAIDVRYAEGQVDISNYIEEEQIDFVLFMHNDRISGMASDYKDAF